MKFLAMLLAVLVHWRDRPPPLAWPARWIPVATAAPEWSRLLTTVAVPAAVAGLLLWLLGGWLWGLLGFLIQLLVLVGCLGGTPWRALLDNLVADGYRGDQQAALHSLDELGVEGAATAVADVDELRAATGEVLAMRFLREWFAVLFWFALLGAPGAPFSCDPARTRCSSSAQGRACCSRSSAAPGLASGASTVTITRRWCARPAISSRERAPRSSINSPNPWRRRARPSITSARRSSATASAH